MSNIDPATLEPLLKKPEQGNNPPSFSHAALAAWYNRIGETKRIARKNNPQGHIPLLNKSQAEEAWDAELEDSFKYVV